MERPDQKEFEAGDRRLSGVQFKQDIAIGIIKENRFKKRCTIGLGMICG
jgi:hypothetical protein